ncbi:MAG: Gfo/Idh/MocA family oxidoreductase [Leptospira sp.]|nr:Gfo/Idh/MocA family oxidoreductase [Leptospira sp.]
MKVLVVGFGSIGSRHTQSLLGSNLVKNITVFDPSDESYSQGLKRIAATELQVERISTLDAVKEHCPDIVILSSTAKDRFSQFEFFAQMGVKRFLVEKIVFQSMEQFHNAISLIQKHEIESFCNFANRYYPNYILLKDLIRNQRLDMRITCGDIGLATSAIHYMDLFEYLSDSPIHDSIGDLKSSLKENKRGKEYKEYNGLILFLTEKGDKLSLFYDASHEANPMIELSFGEHFHVISEGERKERFKNQLNFENKPFEIIPSSILTKQIVEDMLNGNCILTSIQGTMNTHMHLFNVINIMNSKSLDHSEIFSIT